MKAIILSIGNELVLGQSVDTNSAWLSRKFAEIGIPVVRHATIGDDYETIAAEIQRAADEAEVVLITGGLGPTEDDLTRQALAEVMGEKLELREEYAEKLRDFFRKLNRSMPEANLVQACFPLGSDPIENPCGTAPGIHARLGQADVWALPGVPREMRVMYEQSIEPVLAKKSAGGSIVVSTLQCFGAGESDIAEKIRDLMQQGRNPAVGTTAKQGVIGIRIQARGDKVQNSRDLLNKDVEEVRKRLGTLVFGRDEQTMAEAVARLLIDHGQTVATAESCTGGLIAKMLTDVTGSSNYFKEGLVTYSNEAKIRLFGMPEDLIKKHGAVSPQVAELMAIYCRHKAGTDYALSVTGIAGPSGGTPEKPVGLVYIGLADADGCRVIERRLGEHLDRREIRIRTAGNALNILRLQIMDKKFHN